MGECGCFACGNVYKLEGSRGITYLIRTLPACDYCCVGPHIRIEQVKNNDEWKQEELKCTEQLPISLVEDGIPLTIFSAGPSEMDLKKAAKANAFEDCDEITAEVLAEEMYTYLPKRSEIFQGE